MAEGQMMTPADVVAQAMAGEHGDLLRDAVALVVRELMEAEVAQLTGAAARRASAGARDASATAIAPRAWETRVGEIELRDPAQAGRGRRTSRPSWSRGGGASRRSSRW